MLGHLQSTHARLLGVREMLQSVGDFLGPNPRSVENALGALVSARPSDLLILGLAGTLALYLVLRPVVPAFQLKRLVLNAHPASDEGLTARSIHWSTSRAVGIYELEDELFRSLQGRQPAGATLGPGRLWVGLGCPVSHMGSHDREGHPAAPHRRAGVGIAVANGCKLSICVRVASPLDGHTAHAAPPSPYVAGP
jgi:hypothetical protein